MNRLSGYLLSKRSPTPGAVSSTSLSKSTRLLRGGGVSPSRRSRSRRNPPCFRRPTTGRAAGSFIRPAGSRFDFPLPPPGAMARAGSAPSPWAALLGLAGAGTPRFSRTGIAAAAVSRRRIRSPFPASSSGRWRSPVGQHRTLVRLIAGPRPVSRWGSPLHPRTPGSATGWNRVRLSAGPTDVGGYTPILRQFAARSSNPIFSRLWRKKRTPGRCGSRAP